MRLIDLDNPPYKRILAGCGFNLMAPVDGAHD
jgi:hypothetical protein